MRGCGISEEALRDIGDFLLDPSCACCLASIRCDAFDVEEGAKQLDLSNKRLSVASARLLAGVLKFNTTLDAVTLVGCGIDAEGAMALEIALSHNSSLLTIDLSGNKLVSSQDGAEALTRAAAANKVLTSITLDGPGSGSSSRTCAARPAQPGAQAAADGVGHRHRLGLRPQPQPDGPQPRVQRLGPGGANAIVIGINGKPSLRSLNLSDPPRRRRLVGALTSDRATGRSQPGSARDEAEADGDAAAVVEKDKEREKKREGRKSRVTKEGKPEPRVEEERGSADKAESALDVKTRAQLAELIVSVGQVGTLETLALDNNKLSDAESSC